MKSFGLLVFVLASITVMSIYYNNVYAHSFYQNQASVFFTQVILFEIENKLAGDNFPTNVSIALNHSENAFNLLKDILYFNKEVLNDADFVNKYQALLDNHNSTTNALLAANLADESLKQYGLAQGLDIREASGLLNMSMSMAMGPTMNMVDNTSEDESNRGASMLSTDPSLDKILKNSSNDEVINQANYQSAMMLANSLKILFGTTLQNATLQNSTGLMRIPIEMKSESVKSLGEGIDTLLLALNRKAPLEEIFSIVHGQVHPNLFLAFDLKLKGD